MNRRAVILSPSRAAISGVSTHANLLFESRLAAEYELLHFQVGSEGRRESSPGKLMRLVVSPIQFAWFLATRRPDIVHLNTSLDRKAYWRDWMYLAVARLFGRKVVNQIHGGPMPAQFFPGNALLTRLVRTFLKASSVVTVLSRAERDAYIRFAPTVPVVQVPNAIDPAGLLGPIGPADKERPLRLVFVGRLVREKGLFEAIEALAMLRAAGRKMTLDIAGGGKAEQDLRDAVARHGIGDAVRFLGPVFGDAKNRLWQQADIFVFPSYSEGLPYSLLEAMAAGTVPITCPVAAIPDVMRDDVHGLFVPPGDAAALAAAIARLDDDRALLRRMALAGRERVLEQYTTARLAKDFAAVYRQALNA